MNYIIDPKWIYWINTIDKVRTLVTLVGVFSGIVALVLFTISIAAERSDADDEDSRVIRRFLIPIASISAVFIMGAIFIPDRETLVMMQIGKMATFENVEGLIDAVKSAADYVIEAIASLK